MESQEAGNTSAEKRILIKKLRNLHMSSPEGIRNLILIILERNANVIKEAGDEMTVDIDVNRLDAETLLELDRFLTFHGILSSKMNAPPATVEARKKANTAYVPEHWHL